MKKKTVKEVDSVSEYVRPRRERKYRLANCPEGGHVEITGLTFKVTAENVNNEHVIAAIQQCELRTGRKIIGTLIVLD